MENRVINIATVAEVAQALQDIKEEIVFVGGAVVSLYTDDPAADEIRPTKDVDLTLNIVSLTHWQKLQELLGALGFNPDPFGHAICSYKFNDIAVDIMATEDGPLGSANSWCKVGFENLQKTLVGNQQIKILSAPCFLATKFEAFHGRGKDYRTSHDMEDIMYVLDNRLNIVNEIAEDNPKVRAYVKDQLQLIIDKGMLNEVLMAHVHPLMLEERMPIIQDKITQILTH